MYPLQLKQKVRLRINSTIDCFCVSAKEPTTKPSTALKGTGTVKTDELVNYLVEKLPEICQNLQRCTSSSTEQKQRIVSDLLRDYLQPLPEVHVSSSDIFKKRSTTKSYSLFCSTSFESWLCLNRDNGQFFTGIFIGYHIKISHEVFFFPSKTYASHFFLW